jgi:hypothetical protein
LAGYCFLLGLLSLASLRLFKQKNWKSAFCTFAALTFFFVHPGLSWGILPGSTVYLDLTLTHRLIGRPFYSEMLCSPNIPEGILTVMGSLSMCIRSLNMRDLPFIRRLNGSLHNSQNDREIGTIGKMSGGRKHHLRIQLSDSSTLQGFFRKFMSIRIRTLSISLQNC